MHTSSKKYGDAHFGAILGTSGVIFQYQHIQLKRCASHLETKYLLANLLPLNVELGKGAKKNHGSFLKPLIALSVGFQL